MMFRITGMGQVREIVEIAECKGNGRRDYLCRKFVAQFASAFRELFPQKDIKQEDSSKRKLLAEILDDHFFQEY